METKEINVNGEEIQNVTEDLEQAADNAGGKGIWIAIAAIAIGVGIGLGAEKLFKKISDKLDKREKGYVEVEIESNGSESEVIEEVEVDDEN